MKQRIVTGILGGIIFLSLVYIGELWYALLVVALAFIGLHEFLSMARIRIFSLPGLLSYVLLISILWPQLSLGAGKEFSFSLLLMPVTIFLLLYSVFQKNKFHIEHAALVLLGALYIGYGFMYMLATRNEPDNGFYLTLLILLGIWSTDSAAYFVGRAIGKHKLWPAISPNKTIEGALGGLATAIVIVVAANLMFGAVSTGQAALIALVAGTVGQLGDLVESAMKRHFGVKDSGHIIPGHGGVMDRFDSLLFVFPILHLFHLI